MVFLHETHIRIKDHSRLKTPGSVRFSRGSYYEHGNGASRLLAHQLKCSAASRLIPQIKDSSHSMISDPTGINDTFKSFYSSLYRSSDTANMTTFLGELETPTVEAETTNDLDSPSQP